MKRKKGGSIGLIISNNFKFRQRDDLVIDTECFEHLIVELKTRNLLIILVTVYRPPNSNLKEFLHDYKQLIGSVHTKINQNTPIIVGTDHNLDFLKNDVHQIT